MKELSYMERKTIENKANEILTEYHPEHMQGVDVIKIAKQMGFLVGNMSLDENEDGFVLTNKNRLIGDLNTYKIIGVNRDRTPEEKMFIIAHELGHYILRDNKESAIYAHREHKKSKNNNSYEHENDIDYFAACLLMPEDSFKKRYESLKIVYENNSDLIKNDLSNIFCVPVNSVERRIEEVGL